MIATQENFFLNKSWENKRKKMKIQKKKGECWFGLEGFVGSGFELEMVGFSGLTYTWPP